MASEHERPADEVAVQTAPTGDLLPEPEEDEVSGYMMSIPTSLQVDEAGAEEDEVQT